MIDSKRFDPDLPIVLGLAGGSATGKTVTADGIAPPARIGGDHPNEEPHILWDHLYYALPLYKLTSVRQTIEGQKTYDRMAYETLQILLDVFGSSPLYGAPDFNDLIQMVYEIVETPCPREGKPRTFLQHVGTDILRAYDEDVWVKWMERKIKDDHRLFLSENPEPPDNSDLFRPYYGVVVSDCRFPNEVDLIRKHPNGIMLKLTASTEVVAARQEERDGYVMDVPQKVHRSETSLNQIPDEWYDKIIDTDHMTIQEQVSYVKQIVTNFTGAV